MAKRKKATRPKRAKARGTALATVKAARSAQPPAPTFRLLGAPTGELKSMARGLPELPELLAVGAEDRELAIRIIGQAAQHLPGDFLVQVALRMAACATGSRVPPPAAEGG